MGPCVIWIATPDAAAAHRWTSLLGREGWSAAIRGNLPHLVRDAHLLKSLALVDCDVLGRRPAEAVSQAKAKARDISFLLTAGRELPAESVIELLEAGADDFLDFSLPEALLLAKLRTHLRRLLPPQGAEPQRFEAPAGDLMLDVAKRELRMLGRGGWSSVSDLTSTEIKLIGLFLGSPGQALERRFILETVWAAESEQVLPSTVDKHVESLRRKLGKLGSRIRTIYGVGYAYREDSARKEKS